MLRALGQIPSEAEVKELIQEIGSDTFDLKVTEPPFSLQNQINFFFPKDLQKILARRAKEAEPEEDIKEAFLVSYWSNLIQIPPKGKTERIGKLSGTTFTTLLFLGVW